MNKSILNIDTLQNVNNIYYNYVGSITVIYFSNDVLSIFEINIRSINTHFNEPAILLGSINNRFSIDVLCETWHLNDIEFTLNGYKSINSLGTLNKSDGATVLFKESLNILQIKEKWH